MPDSIVWGSAREREVAVATGFRVLPLANAGGTAGTCQVQQLDTTRRGNLIVRRVWPGDAAHLALWQALMTKEKDWGVAPSLEKEKDNG